MCGTLKGQGCERSGEGSLWAGAGRQLLPCYATGTNQLVISQRLRPVLPHSTLVYSCFRYYSLVVLVGKLQLSNQTI